MKRIICLPFVLLCMGAAAQTLPHHSGATLTWDDFKYNDTTLTQPSRLTLHWKIDKYKTTVGNTKVLYPLFSVAVNPYFSSVLPEAKTDEELALNRKLFDLAESFANAASDSALFSSTSPAAIMKYYFDQYTIAADSLRNGVVLPLPYPEDKKWDPADVDWKKPGRGSFWGIGAGMSILPGAAGELITPSLDVQVSAGLYFRRSMVYLDGTLGSSPDRMKNSYWRGAGRNLSVPHLSVTINYAYALRFDRFQVRPFAGVGYSNRGLMDMVRAEKRNLQGITINEGVSLDYYFNPTVNLRGRRHNYSEPGVQFKIYSDQVWLADRKVIMPSVNFSLGLFLTNGRLTRR